MYSFVSRSCQLLESVDLYQQTETRHAQWHAQFFRADLIMLIHRLEKTFNDTSQAVAKAGVLMHNVAVTPCGGRDELYTAVLVNLVFWSKLTQL